MHAFDCLLAELRLVGCKQVCDPNAVGSPENCLASWLAHKEGYARPIDAKQPSDCSAYGRGRG
jgi:hypothetical protein